MDWQGRPRRGDRPAAAREASASLETRHLLRDGAMRVGAKDRAERASRGRPRRDRRREETLLRALLPLQRVFDAADGQAPILDGVNQFLERRGLQVVLAAADEDAVAARFDR